MDGLTVVLLLLAGAVVLTALFFGLLFRLLGGVAFCLLVALVWLL